MEESIERILWSIKFSLESEGETMKNALELQILGIKCDNKSCDYKNENVRYGEFEEWLNKPCPKCGETLLTEADLNSMKSLIKITAFLNKVLPKPKENEKKVTMDVEMNGTGKVEFIIDKENE